MVAVFNPNMVRYHQSMIHQHLEAHSPLTEGHHPPFGGRAATPHPQRILPLCRGGGLCARCADINFPAGINQGQQATPPFTPVYF